LTERVVRRLSRPGELSSCVGATLDELSENI
jgi:hypothetical protein